MISRELTEREKEILGMIRPTTFQDVVNVVRRDVEQLKYYAKRELRNIRNGAAGETSYGVTNDTTNRITDEITKRSNDANKVDNIDNSIYEASMQL